MDDQTREKLNERLVAAAKKGDADGVRVLLEDGADVNGGGESFRALPLIWAAHNGHLAVVEILLAAGADTSLRDSHSHISAVEWARAAGRVDVMRILEPPKSVESPQEVIFSRPLGDRTLQEIFDFAAQERISLIRNGKNGPVEALYREPFSRVEDEAALRKAFAEHVRRGGTADEGEIFPRQIPGKFRLD